MTALSRAGMGMLRDTVTAERTGLRRQASTALGFRQRGLLPLWAAPSDFLPLWARVPELRLTSRVMTTNFTVSLSFSGGRCKWLGSLENTSRYWPRARARVVRVRYSAASPETEGPVGG